MLESAYEAYDTKLAHFTENLSNKSSSIFFGTGVCDGIKLTRKF
jgi:hypothetical protein